VRCRAGVQLARVRSEGPLTLCSCSHSPFCPILALRIAADANGGAGCAFGGFNGYWVDLGDQPWVQSTEHVFGPLLELPGGLDLALAQLCALYS
jgi:hypothetical protein